MSWRVGSAFRRQAEGCLLGQTRTSPPPEETRVWGRTAGGSPQTVTQCEGQANAYTVTVGGVIGTVRRPVTAVMIGVLVLPILVYFIRIIYFYFQTMNLKVKYSGISLDK